jgi:hypothetical protein
MKSLFKIIALFLLNFSVIAQNVTILPSGITPASSIPKLSYDAIIGLPSPNVGDMATDTTFDCLRFYDGKQWAKVSTNKDKSPTGNKASIIGGPGEETCSDMAVDSEGNLYMTGRFTATTIFGNITLTSVGISDVFIVKYNKSGIVQWAKNAGGTLNDIGKSIAIDSTGNIYITGFFSGTATFDNTTVTSAGKEDIFIAKYTNNGTLTWVRKAGGSGNDFSTDIALDKDGNAYITGDYNAGAVFGTKTILNKGGTDIFVVKYTSTGDYEWVKACGGTGGDLSNSIAIDINGAVYITGNFETNAVFGNTTLNSKGGSDIFVAKYDSTNDSWPWVINAGGINNDLSLSIAIDAQGNILVGGGFQDYGYFGNFVLKSAGQFDIFLAKYAPDGSLVWAKRKGGVETEYILKMGLDATGNIYTTGFFWYSVNFGNEQLEAFDQADIFFAKFNPNSQLEWAQSAGGPKDDYSSAIAVEANGDMYAASDSYYMLVFNNLVLNPTGTRDIILFRIRD